MDNSMEIQDIRTRLEQFQANKDPRLKNTMSVPEMRRLLGLKKTESYWLVHRNFFETKIIDGKMRVDIESFEKWYANQVCLLYTSPSPRDVEESRMPSSA